MRAADGRDYCRALNKVYQTDAMPVVQRPKCSEYGLVEGGSEIDGAFALGNGLQLELLVAGGRPDSAICSPPNSAATARAMARCSCSLALAKVCASCIRARPRCGFDLNRLSRLRSATEYWQSADRAHRAPSASLSSHSDDARLAEWSVKWRSFSRTFWKRPQSLGQLRRGYRS